MTRWSEPDDDWDDGPESEDPDFSEDDDEEPTVPCPYCRREIHEDAQRCPYCERYISREDAPPARKPWWMILGVVACLYVVYRWIVWW
jgi:hypothetical protein